MEQKTSKENEVHYVGAIQREPRAVTNEILDRMEVEGFRPALLAFMNRIGVVQLATADDIEV